MLKKLVITVFFDMLKLFLLLFVFCSFLAVELQKNLAWIVRAVGTCLQFSLAKTADLHFTFSLGNVPLSRLISQFAP